MKKITLLIAAITAFAFSTASAQFNVSVVSSTDGGFANISGSLQSDGLSNGIGFPVDGSSSASATFTENSFLRTDFVNTTVGNLDVYKSGTANGAWDASKGAHTFSINIVGTPTAQGGKPGPRWRIIKSQANGATYQNPNWTSLSEGTNTLTIGGGVSFNRMVGFQIAGTMNIDSFSHTSTAGTDTYSIVSAVPEVSHFGLLTGVVVLAFAARRRRA